LRTQVGPLAAFRFSRRNRRARARLGHSRNSRGGCPLRAAYPEKTFSQLFGQVFAAYVNRVIPAGIGTFYLFRSDERRHGFLASRFRRREILPRRRIAELRLEEARQALEPLMEVVAILGRLPDESEFPGAAAVAEKFGSLKRAFRVVQQITSVET